MNSKIRERTILEANEMIKTDQTIREISKKFKVSKSTVQKDLSQRLKYISKSLSKTINEIIKQHIEYRHIKGGITTKKKYQNKRKK